MAKASKRAVTEEVLRRQEVAPSGEANWVDEQFDVTMQVVNANESLLLEM